MAPPAWKLLDQGEEVRAIVPPGHDPRSDHRLSFLSGLCALPSARDRAAPGRLGGGDPQPAALTGAPPGPAPAARERDRRRPRARASGVCLPHGLSIKLDAATNDEIRTALREGTLDFRDRNRFSRYVLNTEHHRRFFVSLAVKGHPRPKFGSADPHDVAVKRLAHQPGFLVGAA